MSLWQLGKQGLTIQPTGEVAASLSKAQQLGRWRAIGLMVVSLVGIVIGSDLLVEASTSLMASFGFSATFFGMTILAFLVSIEELARELPPALQGRPEISFGNVVGSALAMFSYSTSIQFSGAW